jgi:hypothetical protein
MAIFVSHGLEALNMAIKRGLQLSGGQIECQQWSKT